MLSADTEGSIIIQQGRTGCGRWQTSRYEVDGWGLAVSLLREDNYFFERVNGLNSVFSGCVYKL